MQSPTVYLGSHLVLRKNLKGFVVLLLRSENNKSFYLTKVLTYLILEKIRYRVLTASAVMQQQISLKSMSLLR